MNPLLRTYFLLLVPLASGCTINQDLLTAGEQDTGATATDPGQTTNDPTGGLGPTGPSELTGDANGDTGGTADTDDGGGDTGGEDTGCGDTDCPGGFPPSECLRGLLWDDGPIGLTVQTVPDGAHETVRPVLVDVDPVTHDLTPIAEGPSDSHSNAMVRGMDGAFYIGSGANSLSEFSPEPQLLHKFSPAGELLWSLKPNTNGEPVTAAVDIALRGDELVVAGQFGDLRGRSLVDGALLWDIPQTEGSLPNEIEIDGQGAIYLVGTTRWSPNNAPLHTWFIRKFSAGGALLWDDVVAPVDPDRIMFATGLAFDEAGGLIVAFSETDGNPQVGDKRLRKYDSAGAQLWDRAVPELGSQEYLVKMFTRPGGGVFAIGGGRDDGDVPGAVTIAFDPDGELLWVDRQPHPEVTGESNNVGVLVDGELIVSGCGIGGAPPFSQAEGWMLKFAP